MGKNSLALPELAEFLSAAEFEGTQAHLIACLVGLQGFSVDAVVRLHVSDLETDDAGSRTLRVQLMRQSRPVALPLARRTASAIDAYLGGRSAGRLLEWDDGRPLSAPEVLSIVRRTARLAGLGYRLSGE
jgi:integrase/recombinase XerD